MRRKLSFIAAAFTMMVGVAHAESPMQGLVRTPEIRAEQQSCSDYEINKLLWFNSTIVHRLHEMNMDYNGSGTLDPNVYLEVHAELTKEIFTFQDRYETAVKKVILRYPSCNSYVDHEMGRLLAIIQKYPGLENFSY